MRIDEKIPPESSLWDDEDSYSNCIDEDWQDEDDWEDDAFSDEEDW